MGSRYIYDDAETKWRLQSMYWRLHDNLITGKYPAASKSTGSSLYAAPYALYSSTESVQKLF